jgi:hypothetical protein
MRTVAEITGLPGEHRLDGLSPGAAGMVLRGMGGPAGYRFHEFHAGRCALCGRPSRDGQLVDDHDHWVGLVRGLLDRGCNIREGSAYASSDGVLNYRTTNPATILGYREWYTGQGWPAGWWKDLRRARALTDNPTWTPDIEIGAQEDQAVADARADAIAATGLLG